MKLFTSFLQEEIQRFVSSKSSTESEKTSTTFINFFRFQIFRKTIFKIFSSCNTRKQIRNLFVRMNKNLITVLRVPDHSRRVLSLEDEKRVASEVIQMSVTSSL